LSNNFNERSQEFKSQETTLRLFSAACNIKVDNVPEKFQMELPELRGNDMLKHNSHEFSLLGFYKSLPKDELSQLEFAEKKVSLFASTYQCEQLFSGMTFTKSKTRSGFTHLHLKNNLRVAASGIAPNIHTYMHTCARAHTHTHRACRPQWSSG
jgi:hypothetical protein